MNPSFKEDHISQIPALELFQKLGFTYIDPEEAYTMRKMKNSNVILEDILKEQLKRINKITYKGNTYPFSDTNIQNGIEALKTYLYDGLIRTNEKIFDLIMLGKTLEQTIKGDTKSFGLQYIDWINPENNVFHVTEEFEVEKQGSNETRRPDIILFINGIPVAVIECKRPDIEEPIKQAISQQIRNQKQGEIPNLFLYSQLLITISKNEGYYATTGSPMQYWSIWREPDEDWSELQSLIHKPLTQDQKDKLFKGRFKYVRSYFDQLQDRTITEQDKLLYCLCRPERLMEFIYKFIVFDASIKKIARYQQYFAVKNTLETISNLNHEGKRDGGVIWHTQGSGKSILMVFIAKALSLDKEIDNSKIVVVTDRKNLDTQIVKTFQKCGKEAVQASTGQNLIEILNKNKESIITTVINKFKTVVQSSRTVLKSNNIFVLVDESHRTQYGDLHRQMTKVFPLACYIGFTGTPLTKKEKNTFRKFGKMIDKYPMQQAVKDKAVVPLLYEGRHIIQEVQDKTIDTWFDRISEPLTDEQRKDLKKKFSQAGQINKAEQKINCTAYDISQHFQSNWQGTPFKGQLVTPSKDAALKYKNT